MPKARRRSRFSASGEDRRSASAKPDREAASTGDHLPDSDAPAHEEEWEATDENKAETTGEPEPTGPGDAATDELLPAFRLVKNPRTRISTRRRFTLPILGAVAAACLLLGGLIGFALSRTTAEKPLPPAPAPTPAPVRLLTPEDHQELDAAYTARHQNNFSAAEKLFTALAHKDPSLANLEVEVGRTQVYANQGTAAVAILKNALDKGYKPAEAHLLLALLYKRQQSYNLAEANFAQAVALDPTQPDHYYFWGECLREQGKLGEAAPKFRSALLRNQYETATGLYRLKLLLCEIEAGQAEKSGTNAAIDNALAQGLPPMEALFAAAARDLQNGDRAAAVDHLRRARQRADAAVFLVTMTDPVFAPIRGQTEFAEFFRPVESVAPASGNKANPASVPSDPGGPAAIVPTPKTTPAPPKPAP